MFRRARRHPPAQRQRHNPSPCSASGPRGSMPAMLNYSTGIPVMLQCAQLAGLKQIVTSRAFLEKAKLHAPALTRGRPRTSLPRGHPRRRFPAAEVAGSRCSSTRWRAAPACATRTAPRRGHRRRPLHQRLRGRAEGRRAHAPQPAGQRPPGHGAIDVTDTDRFFNALPLFHSFGVHRPARRPARARLLHLSLPLAAALPRSFPRWSTISGLHRDVRDEHLPQRLRAQGPSL
jgi:hypothetical protein